MTKEKFILSLDKFNNKNLIEITLENLRFSFIRRYLEEIIAFKDEVMRDMSKDKIEINKEQEEKNVFFLFF